MKYMTESTERKIIGGVGVFLLITEIGKQLMLTFVVNKGVYSWWYFPWQLCSIPMYVCLIAAAAGHFGGGSEGTGRCASASCARGIYDSCLSFLATFGLMAGAAAFFDTSGFVLAHPLLTVHSYVWHFVLIGTGLFAAARRRDFRFFPPLLIYLGAAAIADIINVAAFDAGCRPINMFYINPRYVFCQAVIKDFVPVIGNTAAIIVYIMFCILGAFLINAAEKYLRLSAASRDESSK